MTAIRQTQHTYYFTKEEDELYLIANITQKLNKAIKRAVYFKFSLLLTVSEVGFVVGLGVEGWDTVGIGAGILLEIEGDDIITEDEGDEPGTDKVRGLELLPMLEAEAVADGSKETEVTF